MLHLVENVDVMAISDSECKMLLPVVGEWGTAWWSERNAVVVVVVVVMTKIMMVMMMTWLRVMGELNHAYP